jgi:uncharacterized ion transporter superfamily protein YfcC
VTRARRFNVPHPLALLTGCVVLGAAAGVRYDDWLKYAVPLFGALMGLGAVAIAAGIAMRLA